MFWKKIIHNGSHRFSHNQNHTIIPARNCNTLPENHPSIWQFTTRISNYSHKHYYKLYINYIINTIIVSTTQWGHESKHLGNGTSQAVAIFLNSGEQQKPLTVETGSSAYWQKQVCWLFTLTQHADDGSCGEAKSPVHGASSVMVHTTPASVTRIIVAVTSITRVMPFRAAARNSILIVLFRSLS